MGALTHQTLLRHASQSYIPFITRLLLVSAFVENAFQTLLDYEHHAHFLNQAHGIPNLIALFLIAVSSITAFLASTMLFLEPLERHGAYSLLLHLLYQHIMYGASSQFHNLLLSSASASTSTSHHHSIFLVRNLCIACILLLLLTHHSCLYQYENNNYSKRKRHLPVTSSTSASRNNVAKAIWRRDAVALITRLLLSLLSVTMITLYATPTWIIIVAPVTLALLCGFMTNFVGPILVTFYTMTAFSQCKFWLLQTSMERHAVRFQFVQTVSIISGILLLSMTGPGDLSLDKRWNWNKLSAYS